MPNNIDMLLVDCVTPVHLHMKMVSLGVYCIGLSYISSASILFYFLFKVCTKRKTASFDCFLLSSSCRKLVSVAFPATAVHYLHTKVLSMHMLICFSFLFNH